MHGAFEPFIEEQRAESAFIHESSFVDTPCRIGEHTSIMHFSHVAAHTIIGNSCFIGHNVTIAAGVLLGDHVRVMNNAQLNSGVIMENTVYCGANTVFVDNRHVRSHNTNISRISPTLVRHGAQIGPHSTVSSGFTIGRFSFIEAGTVIDRNVPDFAVVYGNPLKFIGWRCECGQTMPTSPHKAQQDEEFTCSYCGRTYLRQSKWKLLQLSPSGQEGTQARDSHFEFNPSVRTAQRPD